MANIENVIEFLNIIANKQTEPTPYHNAIFYAKKNGLISDNEFKEMHANNVGRSLGERNKAMANYIFGKILNDPNLQDFSPTESNKFIPLLIAAYEKLEVQTEKMPKGTQIQYDNSYSTQIDLAMLFCEEQLDETIHLASQNSLASLAKYVSVPNHYNKDRVGFLPDTTVDEACAVLFSKTSNTKFIKDLFKRPPTEIVAQINRSKAEGKHFVTTTMTISNHFVGITIDTRTNQIFFDNSLLGSCFFDEPSRTVFLSEHLKKFVDLHFKNLLKVDPSFTLIDDGYMTRDGVLFTPNRSNPKALKQLGNHACGPCTFINLARRTRNLDRVTNVFGKGISKLNPDIDQTGLEFLANENTNEGISIFMMAIEKTSQEIKKHKAKSTSSIQPAVPRPSRVTPVATSTQSNSLPNLSDSTSPSITNQPTLAQVAAPITIMRASEIPENIRNVARQILELVQSINNKTTYFSKSDAKMLTSKKDKTFVKDEIEGLMADLDDTQKQQIIFLLSIPQIEYIDAANVNVDSNYRDGINNARLMLAINSAQDGHSKQKDSDNLQRTIKVIVREHMRNKTDNFESPILSSFVCELANSINYQQIQTLSAERLCGFLDSKIGDQEVFASVKNGDDAKKISFVDSIINSVADKVLILDENKLEFIGLLRKEILSKLGLAFKTQDVQSSTSTARAARPSQSIHSTSGTKTNPQKGVSPNN